MARVWEVKWDISSIGATGNWNPSNGIMTFPGGGTTGDIISGTFFADIPADPFIYLDGVLTAVADLPLYFTVDDAYDIVAGLINHNYSGLDTCSIVFATATVTPPTDPPSIFYPQTGMTLPILLSLTGTSIVATASATCAFNGQSAAQIVGGFYWGYRGTFTTPIPSAGPPLIDAGPGATITPPLPATVTATGTFENAPPAGATITYLWEFLEGPAGALSPIILSATSLVTNIEFHEKIVGLYKFKLTSSGDALYGVPPSSDTVTFIVPVPRPPIVQAIRTTVTP